MTIDLSHTELCTLRKLRNIVSECETHNEIRRVSLKLLEQLIQTNASNFYITMQQGDKWKTDDFIGRGLRDDKYEEYNQYYHQLDPFQKIGPHVNQILIGEKTIDWPRHLKSEYYSDFLRPQGIHHMMNMWIDGADDIYSVLAFFRPVQQKPFENHDQVLCELAAPHITAALRKVHYKKKIFRLQKAAKALLSAVPLKGVVILDDRLQVLCSNHEANEVMAAANRNIEKRDAGSLPIEISSACLELKEKAATGDNSRHFQIELEEPFGVMSVEVRMIEYEDNTCLFLIKFGEYALVNNWARKLKAKHISRRELDVVKCVFDGLTNREISQQLFISEYTVENHLKSIFRKMDVKSRTHLVRQVLDTL